MAKVIDFLEEWLITLLMGGATLLIFLSVLHRYGSGYAIPYVQDWLLSLHFSWAQELCIIMFVCQGDGHDVAQHPAHIRSHAIVG